MVIAQLGLHIDTATVEYKFHGMLKSSLITTALIVPRLVICLSTYAKGSTGQEVKHANDEYAP